MPAIQAIRIAVDGSDRVLTRDQKRFNTLSRQIEQARSTLEAWQDKVAPYGEAHVQVLLPLQAQWRALRRQWVFKLDLASQRFKWTRTERETLQAVLCEAAAELLGADDDDVELKALFARHAQVEFDTERQEALQALKELTEAMTGLDLGDDQGLTSEEDLLRRVHEGVQEQAAAADAMREAKASKRRKTAAQQRREDEARQATQSVREVFRKLASALHPDRETDLRQREAKTALMQEVNQAYAKNDLLALLELQLRIEQIDAGHLAAADPQRVRHYNKVLAEQLDEIRTEIAHAEMRFCMDFGVEPGRSLNPLKLGELLEREARHWRAALVLATQDLDLLDDPAASKRWLKAIRRDFRERDRDLDFF
ncbi:J domain-containing protein [Aquabacterium sp. A7-Y]|uniref:J domain-containing protein n=1 Tax=Aquabacterium sp. A7-Y TaxID=1349605 RepID=UPI00223D1769|nr:J domain-containing protein [Aquabacterium sp. A7-Y]MCW7541888.1 J domain-containing protein [Aquabacterium sp. A7-Y]